MWARIQEMAIRQEAPDPLELGTTINGITIRGRLPCRIGNRRYQGIQENRLVEVRQFYDVDTPSFLRWQQQARLSTLKQHPLLVQAFMEWEGGVILPDLRLPPLTASLKRERALDFLYKLATILASLHSHGIAHLNICPQSILYNPANNTPLVSRFGQSKYPHWQDLWWGIKRPVIGSRFAAPEVVSGHAALGTPADVFSFGALTRQLTSPPAKGGWTSFFPGLWRKGERNSGHHLPPPVQSLLKNTQRSAPEDRPTMQEAAAVLHEYAQAEFHMALDQEHTPLSPPCTQRILLFIKPDIHAKKLFAKALSLSKKANTALLFVSLIPTNLAYGELELFKGRLFKSLGAGLRACRKHNTIWGLRLLENVDAEKAARQLTKRLAPDLVFCGTPTQKGVLRRMLPGVVTSIEKGGQNVSLVDGRK